MKRVFILYMCLIQCHALHLKGTWRSNEIFFKFLTRFGFQQTNVNDVVSTQGYVYGNVTLINGNSFPELTLAVVDSEYFLDLYENQMLRPSATACHAMFKKIDLKVWDEKCHSNNSEGREDYLRRIPCPQSRLCVDENKPSLVIPGYQFTFRIQDMVQPRFWYISLIACSRNMSTDGQCSWTAAPDVELSYDIWFVNGSPLTWRQANPFEHQFSFEQHDIVEAFAAFACFYTLLVPVQLWALSRQRHLLMLLLTVCMCLEYIGVLLNIVHVAVFSANGVGVPALHMTALVVDNAAQSLFMLLLLLVVKGWTITRKHLHWRAAAVLLTLWLSYSIANMALFIWNQMEIDERSGVGEWQTWPGRLILLFRLILMCWFILELRETFVLERVEEKCRFYLHFGAGFLVWFVYLPLATLICTLISPLWTYKTMLGITYSADFISYCVMTHLLWPSRSYIYFSLRTNVPVDAHYTGMLADCSSSSEDSLDIHELHEMNTVTQDTGQNSLDVLPPSETIQNSTANGILGEARLKVVEPSTTNTETLLVEVDLERDPSKQPYTSQRNDMV